MVSPVLPDCFAVRCPFVDQLHRGTAIEWLSKWQLLDLGMVIVMQSLEKDAAKRVQSARELTRQLAELSGVCEWSPEQAKQWWATTMVQ